MPTIKEKADAEADRVEAEEAAEAADHPDEPIADEPDIPFEGDAGQSIDKALREFERENTRHAEALADVMGDDFEAFEPCEHCNGVGFKPRMPFKRDPTLTMCEACDGHGVLVTGSLNPQTAVRQCMTCGGNGFITKPSPAPAAAQAPAVARFDPYTGQPIERPYDLPTQQVPEGSGWAPGYTPPAGPVPSGV